MRGVLNIDKPPGCTSHDVVARVRRLSNVKRTGHAGTLDPDATGVLLVCMGEATRLAEYLVDAGKEYRAVLSLGRTTTTEDASGETLTLVDASHVTEADICRTLPAFVGDILQVPPMVSALHHEGQRLYDLARQGITVERAARPVRVDRITLSNFEAGPEASAVFHVQCGKGTYIRTLCADIGAALGVGGHMKVLRRTRVGAFDVAQSVALDDLTLDNIASYLVSPAEALGDVPAVVLSPAELVDVRHGRAVAGDAPAGVVRLLSHDGELIALARADGGTLRPFKVFAG